MGTLCKFLYNVTTTLSQGGQLLPEDVGTPLAEGEQSPDDIPTFPNKKQIKHSLLLGILGLLRARSHSEKNCLQRSLFAQIQIQRKLSRDVLPAPGRCTF